MQLLERITIVGAGRLGTALAQAADSAGLTVQGPLRRGESAVEPTDAVLLCVPDQAIADAAAALRVGPPVGHCSGATGLAPLEPHTAFSFHPLMTVSSGAQTSFAGVPCAIAGHPIARSLAERLGMRPIEIAEADRAAYHAAASMASNFLVTLEQAAAHLGATVGLERADLLPLVRATVENWAQQGPEALTGPIRRGDLATVARHREALRERAPELLSLYDALAEVTAR